MEIQEWNMAELHDTLGPLGACFHGKISLIILWRFPFRHDGLPPYHHPPNFDRWMIVPFTKTNHPFWGSPILGNPHMCVYVLKR